MRFNIKFKVILSTILAQLILMCIGGVLIFTTMMKSGGFPVFLTIFVIIGILLIMGGILFFQLTRLLKPIKKVIGILKEFENGAGDLSLRCDYKGKDEFEMWRSCYTQVNVCWAMDLVGPLPQSHGYEYIITLVDMCDGYIIIAPMRTLTFSVSLWMVCSCVFQSYLKCICQTLHQT